MGNEKELTVRDVINTMTDAQKNTLYFYIGTAIREKVKIKPPYAAIESFNEDQRKVFYYLIGVALDKFYESDVLEIVKE
jgi:hypothetical protein